MDTSGIRQHKVMAMGGDIGAGQGIQSLASMAKSTGSTALGARTMKDGERNALVGSQQGNPDHGDPY